MNTIYSRSEESYMKRLQEQKARWFGPLVSFLIRIGVSANIVSVASALIAIGGAALAIYFDNEWLFVVAIWLHFILDGIDGTLARAQGTPGMRGVIFDLAADTVGILALSYAMIAFQNVPLFLGSVFCVSYVALNALSLILMAQGKRYEFVIRPRVYIFCAIPVYLLFSSSFTLFLLELMVVGAAVVQIYFCVKGLVLLTQRA